ncbi:hypothetical protein AVEN_209548-1 [Araneus ventricosus]|uniref:Uncharacterized protein n=1 Tax=Araneus ventricosus TaxID=182803 RepID=A0A4Y2PB07_ARAVE|nr:hypothetical protein AVEN_209548-1 [Araneus ventricosus]
MYAPATVRQCHTIEKTPYRLSRGRRLHASDTIQTSACTGHYTKDKHSEFAGSKQSGGCKWHPKQRITCSDPFLPLSNRFTVLEGRFQKAHTKGSLNSLADGLSPRII